MSERTVRLCDFVVGSLVCQQPFMAVCPLCERDTCTSHMGGNHLGPNIRISASKGSDLILGDSGVRVCNACAEALRALAATPNADARTEFGVLASSIQARVVEAARARLAEWKLTKGV